MEKKSRTYRVLVAKINRHIADNSWANTPMSRWYVGVANLPNRKDDEYYRAYGPCILHYTVFYAYSNRIATQVVDYFLRKGAAKHPQELSTKDCRWVYVHKVPMLYTDRSFKSL